MDAELLGGHGWRGISRNDQAIPYAVSRQVGRFHPAPCNGAGLPAPLIKGTSNLTIQIDSLLHFSLPAATNT